MNITEALAYIHSNAWKGSVPGLSRTAELLHRMGDPQKKLRFIHIAGTNGKGSTAAMLESIFRTAGYCTGLYTSPYITRFHERMQVNGCAIADEQLCAITEAVQPLADAMDDCPTEFELITCIAMEYFARSGCDIVLLEAGMGGALDSTNVIDCPECAVICTIGLDHTEYLGSTTAEIARTKAGIFKENGLCITHPAESTVEAVYQEAAKERNLDWRIAATDAVVPKFHDLGGQVFEYGNYHDLTLPLLGRHQLCNAAVVLTVVDAMRERGWTISEQQVADGLAATQWPGRFEVLQRTSPLFIVDGGHNPQCMQAVVQNLQDYLPGRQVTLLAGVMADKDTAAMFRMLQPYVSHAVAVTPNNPRAMQAEALAQLLQDNGMPAAAANSIEEGVKQACNLAGANGVVLALGSLYMVGDIRAAVLN